MRYYFDKWVANGTFADLNLALGRELRKLLGREAEPSAAIMDSQSVKTVLYSADESGYDGAKKIKGRKRFILVDTLGLLVVVLVTAASVPERVGGEQLLEQAHDSGQRRLEVVYADAGYDGPKLENAVAATSGWRLECSPRAKKRTLGEGEVGFVVQQWRWIVERTFGWLNWWRQLSKDYERKAMNSEAMIQIAMSRMTLRRLAKLQISQTSP